MMALPPKLVLIVEDDPLIMVDTCCNVEDAGFDVLMATNADQAIKLLETRPDIRIVITDIEMPGSMDGLKLAAAVRKRWPPVELIISSAFRIPTSDEMPERSVFLSKPYPVHELHNALQSFV
jgi:CheY-like chemotaxis protein